MSELRLTPGQLSAAVGSVQVTAVVQRPASVLWVMSAGGPLIAGVAAAGTVTLTVVVPRKKVVPDAMSEESETRGQLSAAVGAGQVAAGVERPAGEGGERSGGGAANGGVALSVKKTVEGERKLVPGAPLSEAA